jgi:hypothetical protein
MLEKSLRTRDTVWWETPAHAATSAIVGAGRSRTCGSWSHGRDEYHAETVTTRSARSDER